MRLVHLWSARAKQAVILRIPSDTLPRRAAYFSDGTTLGYRSWPPPWPRYAACALLKTRNQLNAKAFLGEMPVVGQDVHQSLAAHHVHGDAIGEATVLIEPGFIEG